MSKEKQIAIGNELKKLINLAKSGKSYGNIETKASAGLGEEVTNSGTNLTRPEILRDILKSDFMAGSIYDRCQKIDVSDKANGLFMVVNKETTRNSVAGIMGGIIVYDLEEGDTITETHPQVDQTTLSLNRKGVRARVTNALLQDSLVLEQYLSKGMAESIKFYTDESILYGNGVNGCNGILDASGNRVTKYVSCANPITIQNLKDMVKWYYGGSNGCWVMGRDIYYEVVNLYANTLPLTFGENGQAYLFGYPIIRKDSVTARCLLLADFSQFLVAQKPIREDISEHLYFDTNETAFRTIFRLNGMPTWYSPITEESGQVTYPFVCCMDQDTESSSSSSSENYSNSSESSDSSSSSSENHSESSSSSSENYSESSSSSSSRHV